MENIKEVLLGDFVINVLENDLLGIGLINGSIWEPHIVEFLNRELTPNSNFVDVGSNYGYHSIRASKLCKKVFSFEPQTLMYNLSKKSLIDNNINNVEVYNLALGDEEKEINLSNINYSEKDFNGGEVSVVYDSNFGETTKIVKLDTMIEDPIDVIKIDVQGYEKFVINGAQEIIKKNKPILIVEFENHQLNKFGYNCKILFDFIRNLNYTIFLLDYFYPSDFVCVHNDNLINFRQKHGDDISQLTENNHLNNCLVHGVNEIIRYSEDIKYNRIKHSLDKL